MLQKDINLEALSEVIKVASRKGLDKEDFASIIEELTYVARDNGYDDDMLCQISELLYQ